MKRKVALALLCVTLLVTGLVGCDYVTGMKPAAATQNATRYLTDQQLLQWREGSLHVITQQRASALAGFDVKTPDYLPPGFVPSGGYTVINDIPLMEKIYRGTGPDASGVPPVGPDTASVEHHVLQSWHTPRAPGAPDLVMVLMQFDTLFGESGLMPATIGGTPVEKAVKTLGAGSNVTRVDYVWQQDGTTLLMSGIFGGGIADADYDRVVRSIIKQP